MKKIIVLLMFIIIITGCHAEYKITINGDLTLTEEASLTGTEDFFSKYYKTTKINVIKSYIDIYRGYLDENNYQYEIIEDNIPYVKVNKIYKNVSDYTKESILFNGYFDEVKYSENGDIKKIETIGFYEGNPDDNEDRFYVSQLNIAIKCSYKVINHNAKEVDKKTNTYYYDLSKDNKILLEYDTSSRFDPNSELIKIIIISVAGVVVLWGLIIVSSKKNKNNMI